MVNKILFILLLPIIIIWLIIGLVLYIFGDSCNKTVTEKEQ